MIDTWRGGVRPLWQVLAEMRAHQFPGCVCVLVHVPWGQQWFEE